MNCLPSLGAGTPVLGCLLPAGDAECSPLDRLQMRSVIYQRALEAMIAFETGRFTSLDVAAGDQACQIRALQFCMLNLEGLDVLKRTIKARLSALAELEETFTLLDKECESRVAKIENESLEPLVEENRTIGAEREEALEGIDAKDPKRKEIGRRFAKRFKAVALKKQPILKEISELQQACRIKQKRLIEDDGLEMIVDPEAILVIRSYLVTLVKVDIVSKEEFGAFTYQTRFNPKILGEGSFAVSTTQLIDIVENAKQAICSGSIEFVQKEAIAIKNDRLQTFVAKPRFVVSKERSELPFFHMTQVIFQSAMARKIPVLLKVRNIECHPLKSESFISSALLKSDGSSYEISPVLSEDLERRVIVIEGISRQAIEALKAPEYMETMLEISGGLLRMIDLNTAQHGQYTDQTESSEGMFRAIPGMVDEEEADLVSLFKEAVANGFSLTNPEQFCIDHVYCDLLANQRVG